MQKFIKGVVMKIAVQCENLLLQSTLEYFLRQYISSQESCDFILSDVQRIANKPVCVLGDCNIPQPFTPQSLLQALQDFYENLTPLHTSTLESEISQLLTEYTHKLYELFKKHS